MADPKRNKFSYAHANDIVWMSQNTNHLPVDPAVQEAMAQAVSEAQYNKYPRPGGIPGFFDLIKEDLEIPFHDILLTAGGIEGIYAFTRALIESGDEMISTDPSFLPIHHCVELSGGKAIELPIYQEPWKLTADQVMDAVNPKSRMLLLIDPINPLGTGYSRDEVKALSDIAEDHGLWLVHDITYRDFARSHTMSTEFLPEKSIVVFSFSKNCGFAGMRIGGISATPELMKSIKPYDTNVLSVNVIAQYAAREALRTKDKWLPGMLAQCRENQERIKQVVEGLEGAFMPVYPSDTNMFVIDISESGIDPNDLEDKLLFDHNVFVRSGNYVSKQFGSRFVRTSFAIPSEWIDRFCEAFPVAYESLL